VSIRSSVCKPLGTGVAIGGVALATAAVALAARPLKGATYKGTASNGATVQFKVSATGKTVKGFKISYAPLACQGAEPAVKSGGSATISRKGRFKVTRPMYFPPTQPSRVVGTVVVTGTFGKHGKEAGKLKSQFSGKHDFSKSCDDTIGYSTTG
jgi:hypothetical protein